MAESAEVQSAVNWGRRLDDPRLRAAAVDLARTSLAAMAAARARSRVARIFVWFGAVYALLVVAGFVFALVLDEGIRASLWLAVLNVVFIAGGPLLAQHHLRRAIERNSDSGDAPGE